MLTQKTLAALIAALVIVALASLAAVSVFHCVAAHSALLDHQPLGRASASIDVCCGTVCLTALAGTLMFAPMLIHLLSRLTDPSPISQRIGLPRLVPPPRFSSALS